MKMDITNIKSIAELAEVLADSCKKESILSGVSRSARLFTDRECEGRLGNQLLSNFYHSKDHNLFLTKEEAVSIQRRDAIVMTLVVLDSKILYRQRAEIIEEFNAMFVGLDLDLIEIVLNKENIKHYQEILDIAEEEITLRLISNMTKYLVHNSRFNSDLSKIKYSDMSTVDSIVQLYKNYIGDNLIYKYVNSRVIKYKLKELEVNKI